MNNPHPPPTKVSRKRKRRLSGRERVAFASWLAAVVLLAIAGGYSMNYGVGFFYGLTSQDLPLWLAPASAVLPMMLLAIVSSLLRLPERFFLPNQAEGPEK